MNLITLEELKQWLQIEKEDTSNDLILNIYIEGCTEMITGLIGRNIFAEDYVEKYAGTDTNSLVLKHFPVNDVKEIVYIVDNEIVGKVEDYELKAKSGILYKDLAWWVEGGSRLMSGNLTYPRRHIRVSYNAGYDKVPGDLKLLALQLISSQIGFDKSESSTQGLRRYTISDVTWEWKNENKLTESQQAIISKYRSINI